MQTRIILLVGCIFLVLVSCKNKAALDGSGVPEKLIIAVTTAGDNTGRIQNAFVPLKQYLEKKLGLKVEVLFSNDYTSVIEAIRAKKVHMAYLQPFSYVLAAQKQDIRPILVIGEDGKPSMYHCVIFTNPASGLKDIDDLKARARDITLCFADPASTSGHLIPRAYLTTIGLNPDQAFKQVVFAGNHQSAVLAVASRKVDVGCSALEYGISLMIRNKLVKPEQIRMLWQSDPIVSSPIVVRNDLNRQFVNKISQAYLDMRKDAPDVLMVFLKLYRLNPENLSFMPADDSMYNGIRKIASGIPDLAAVK